MLVTGCVRAAPVVAPDAPSILAVVTWNMDAGRGDLPRLADDLSSGRLAGGRPVPDYALLLQEAVAGGPRDVLAFARARGLSAYFAPVRERAGGASGNAILSTRPLGATRTVALPRERQPRVAAAAEIGIGGITLLLMSAHLENRLGLLDGVFADVARGRQAEALISSVPAGAHAAVGGDMNTMLGPDEPAWRVLVKRFPDTPHERLQPTFRNRLVLDHLFFDLPDGWHAFQRVVSDRYGSDHHPVIGLISAEGREASIHGRG